MPKTDRKHETELKEKKALHPGRVLHAWEHLASQNTGCRWHKGHWEIPSKPERLRSKHIAEKERAVKCDMKWRKHMLREKRLDRTERREKEEPRRETDLKDRRQVVAHAVFLALK